MSIQASDNGDVVFLATRAAGQVAAQTPSGASVYRGARSGNSNFDPASGRFASKSNKEPAKGAPVNPVVINQSGLPQGVTQDEWDRRKDSVKDLARTVEEITEQSAQDFLQGRVADLSKVDVAAFVADARQQQLDDLADFLAQQMGGKQAVAIKAPRAYAPRILTKLDDGVIVGLLRRLEARGFDKKTITKKVINKLDKDRRESIKQSFGASV